MGAWVLAGARTGLIVRLFDEVHSDFGLLVFLFLGVLLLLVAARDGFLFGLRVFFGLSLVVRLVDQVLVVVLLQVLFWVELVLLHFLLIFLLEQVVLLDAGGVQRHNQSLRALEFFEILRVDDVGRNGVKRELDRVG